MNQTAGPDTFRKRNNTVQKIRHIDKPSKDPYHDKFNMTQTLNPLSANFTQEAIDETAELALPDPNSNLNSNFNNSKEQLIDNNGQITTLRIVDENGDDQNQQPNI